MNICTFMERRIDYNVLLPIIGDYIFIKTACFVVGWAIKRCLYTTSTS